jgi:hypothetical protein
MQVRTTFFPTILEALFCRFGLIWKYLNKVKKIRSLEMEFNVVII